LNLRTLQRDRSRDQAWVSGVESTEMLAAMATSALGDETVYPVRPHDVAIVQGGGGFVQRVPFNIPGYAGTSLGSPDLSFGFRTTWGLLSLASAIVSGYHAHRRYKGNVGWTVGWSLGGAVFPIVVPVIALIQGFGQPRKGNKGFGRGHSKRRRRPLMRHYRRRTEA
jgi:hypothetical protein